MVPTRERIDPEATKAFMTAVGHHDERDLLLRAMESYRRALENWVPELQLLAGEFLYIAGETLSRFLIESRASAQGMTPKNLARLEKANGEKALRQRYLAQEIFDGDIEALEAMQQASDGFEHGYMAVQDVRGLLEPVLERSMAHVRQRAYHRVGIGGRSR
jgi:hypothetical protein